MSNIETLRAYHADAEQRLRSYADDSGLRPSDVKHYTKRAEFHAAMVKEIDRLAAQQHPHNDGLDEYRGAPE